ncbi:hypothetical protein HPB47_012960 [Ixodes persulcatus]|uniref:Uncharacterized protein n=1 Tax=Ixodes persulcatus TaxID=34615 RepID=A0AC60NS39_IXOPE|nr:hypothetical protein HPB47_012960 [Ixodes persulcatus]
MVHQLNDVFKSLHDERDELAAQVHQMACDKEANEHALADLKADITGLYGAISNYEEELAEAHAEVESMRAQNEELSNLAAEVNEKLKQEMELRENDRLKDRLKELQKKVEGLNFDLRHTRDVEANKRSQMDKLYKEAQNEIKLLNKTLADVALEGIVNQIVNKEASDSLTSDKSFHVVVVPAKSDTTSSVIQGSLVVYSGFSWWRQAGHRGCSLSSAFFEFFSRV